MPEKMLEVETVELPDDWSEEGDSEDEDYGKFDWEDSSGSSFNFSSFASVIFKKIKQIFLWYFIMKNTFCVLKKNILDI